MKAFPYGDQSFAQNRGMTLRDYFAGQALAAVPVRNWSMIEGGDQAVIEAWARCAYAAADAMLKVRDGG